VPLAKDAPQGEREPGGAVPRGDHDRDLHRAILSRLIDGLDESLTFDIANADPIFILGIMPRSGTNYLWDLLRLHPACTPAREPIREDFFIEESDDLLAFTRHVADRWDPMWGEVDDEVMRRFHESLGDGLISFLWIDPDRRLLAKTPSVRHIDRFFTFFPRARLLVLVRDGRSVVQSCMSTFGWEFDRAARDWAAAADGIRRFVETPRPSTERHMLVRYEDLIEDLKRTLSTVLRFVELDEDDFDFGAAAELPVRGSSSYFGNGRDSVHWDPVPAGPDFDPRERWRSWTPDMHERFEWIAGNLSRYFGYTLPNDPVRGPGKIVRHRFLDARWRTKTTARSAAYRARVKVGTATRPLRERLGLVRTDR
jgi:Sulfotransferase family